MTEIVFLGLNDIGDRVYEWLNQRDDNKIVTLLTEKDQLPIVKDIEPDLIISAGFRHIVPEEIIEIPEKGAVNFHKAYLPYNRGANPNVWSIMQDNPAGVTLHYMTPEMDAGPIIDRREVKVRQEDDARDLYERLENAQFKQFVEVWSDIREGNVETTEQDEGEATHHYKKDFVDLWKIDTQSKLEAGELIKRLRALTFPPYKNAYFVENGKRYYIDIEITPEEKAVDKEPEKEKNVPRYTEEEY